MVGHSFLRQLRNISILAVTLLVFTLFCGFDSTGQKVYDDAGLFTSAQINRLEQMCIEKAGETETDFIIVTTNSTNGKSSMDYAEDFYMAHDFGYDTLHGDGVILLINMEDREVWMSTSGKAISYLSDTRIDNIISAVTAKLSSGSYYDGCTVFLTKTANYMTYLPSSADAVEGDGDTMTVHDAASLSEKLAYYWPVKVGIAAALALLVTILLRLQNKPKMAVGSTSYMHNNKYKITHQRDQYIRTTRVRHSKSTSSGSHGGSSGSSSHSGSGGHSFGGGGGKF